MRKSKVKIRKRFLNWIVKFMTSLLRITGLKNLESKKKDSKHLRFNFNQNLKQREKNVNKKWTSWRETRSKPLRPSERRCCTRSRRQRLTCWHWMTNSFRLQQDWQFCKITNLQLSLSINRSKLSSYFIKTNKCRVKLTPWREMYRFIRKLRRNLPKEAISVKRLSRGWKSKSRTSRWTSLALAQWWAVAQSEVWAEDKIENLDKETSSWSQTTKLLTLLKIKLMRIWLTFWSTSWRKSKRNASKHNKNMSFSNLIILISKTKWMFHERNTREQHFWWQSSLMISWTKPQIF